MRVVLRGRVGTTEISSNILTHKVVRYSSLVNTPIFTFLLPNTHEQYTDIPVQYMLSYGDEERTYDLAIYVNDEDQPLTT
jgi:hypothetical protein